MLDSGAGLALESTFALPCVYLSMGVIVCVMLVHECDCVTTIYLSMSVMACLM